MSQVLEIPTDLGGFLRGHRAYLEVLVDEGDVVPKALILTTRLDGVTQVYPRTETYDHDHPLWCLIESQIDQQHIEDVVFDRENQ